MFPIIRSPRILALLTAGFAALSTGALADHYGYGGPYGGNGGYGRPTYGGENRPYNQPHRGYGDAGYRGPNGYNGGGTRPQGHGGYPQYGYTNPQQNPQGYKRVKKF